MKLTALIFSFLVASLAIASGPSAMRAPGVPASAYFPIRKDSAFRTSAFSQRASLNQVDIKKVPEVSGYAFIQEKFTSLRDKRFLETPDQDFLRRITWLYPDDGCYARAEVLSHQLEEDKAPAAAKVFVFGDLRAKTANSPRGFVTWWYHVAVAYRVSSVVYIFDPSIEAKRPLTLDEWVGLVSPAIGNATVSICASHTFEPDSDCVNPTNKTERAYDEEKENYLEKEWSRLEDLGRNPEKELGDLPPWR